MGQNGDRWVEPRMPDLARLGRIDLEALVCELWAALGEQVADQAVRERLDRISGRYYRAWESVGD